MVEAEAPKKKVGRPAKALGKRQSYAFRMNEPVRAVVAAAAEANGRSLSEEIERRVELSLYYEKFLGNMATPGHAADMFNALHKVVGKVLRMSMNMPDDMRGDPLSFEIATRKEMHTAVEVIMHAYAATEARRTLDPNNDVALSANTKWGDGVKAALNAYNFLELNDDNHLEKAKDTAIDDWWTGDGRYVGQLRMTLEEAEWRRWQGHPPSPLKTARDGIPNAPYVPGDLNPDDEEDAPPPGKAKPARSKQQKP